MAELFDFTCCRQDASCEPEIRFFEELGALREAVAGRRLVGLPRVERVHFLAIVALRPFVQQRLVGTSRFEGCGVVDPSGLLRPTINQSIYCN